MAYLTLNMDCTKTTVDLVSLEWDEETMGEPTEENVLKALREGNACYDIIDSDGTIETIDDVYNIEIEGE